MGHRATGYLSLLMPDMSNNEVPRESGRQYPVACCHRQQFLGFVCEFYPHHKLQAGLLVQGAGAPSFYFIYIYRHGLRARARARACVCVKDRQTDRQTDRERQRYLRACMRIRVCQWVCEFARARARACVSVDVRRARKSLTEKKVPSRHAAGYSPVWNEGR